MSELVGIALLPDASVPALPSTGGGAASANGVGSGGEEGGAFLTALQLATVALSQGRGLRLATADAEAGAEMDASKEGDAIDSPGDEVFPAGPGMAGPEPGRGVSSDPGGALDSLGTAASDPDGTESTASSELAEALRAEALRAEALRAEADSPGARASTSEPPKSARGFGALAEGTHADRGTPPRAGAGAETAAISASESSRETDSTEAERARSGTPSLELVGTGVARAAEAQSSAPAQDAPALAASPSAEAARDPAAGRELRALPELPVRNETEIVREVRMLAHSGGGHARIQLHPPQLGDLSLRVTVTEHAISVSFVAEHGQIAELLSRHMPELRQVLQSSGVRADSLDLDAHTASDEAGAEEWTGFARDGDARGTRSGIGFGAGGLVDAWPPLPRVAPNSLGTLDLVI